MFLFLQLFSAGVKYSIYIVYLLLVVCSLARLDEFLTIKARQIEGDYNKSWLRARWTLNCLFDTDNLKFSISIIL